MPRPARTHANVNVDTLEEGNCYMVTAVDEPFISLEGDVRFRLNRGPRFWEAAESVVGDPDNGWVPTYSGTTAGRLESWPEGF